MEIANIKIKRKALQIFYLSVLGIFFLFMVYYLRSIFNPLLIALILAYVLNPLVNRLEQWKIPRTVTIFAIYLFLSATIVLVFLILMPMVGMEINVLYKKAFVGEEGSPAYIATALNSAKKAVEQWNDKHPMQKIEWNATLKQDLVQKLFSFSSTTLETMLETLLSVFSVLSYLILLPLYTFFFMRSLNNIWASLQEYFPPAHKSYILQILGRMHKAISCFFRGKLIICILKGFLTWLCLEIAGQKFGLIFGSIQAVASMIPFLVLVIGMLPHLVLILLDIGMSWPHLFGIFALYMAIEGIEAFILTPWILGKETGLHPVSIILSLLIGGKLFGLLGLLLAIPVTTSFKILGQEIIVPHLKEILQIPQLPPQ